MAYVIVTDRFHTGRRTTPMSLAAEIQHQLLPSAACCEAARFTIAVALVPADDIGGDTYDYGLGRETLHLSITDAAGHDVASALTATLPAGALRGVRRAGRDLTQQANQALLDHGDVSLVAGLLLRVDLRPGDRLVLLADGMYERDAADADLAALIRQSGGLHTTEPVRAATRAVTHACDGHLQDDATVLCFDWHGIRRTERQAGNGADTDIASPPGPSEG